MKNVLLVLILFFYSMSLSAQFQSAKAPVADKKEHWRDIHGDKVLDNYYWMYDYFGKGADSTNVVNYLKAENEYPGTAWNFISQRGAVYPFGNGAPKPIKL